MAAPILSSKRFEHVLEQPFVNARGSWTRHAFLALERADGAGRVGHGEASPLPGYSPDAIDDCQRVLSTIGELRELISSASAQQVFDRVSAAVPERFPAARFGLETAALDRLGGVLQRPVWSLLAGAAGIPAGKPPSVIAPCAVLPSGDVPAALSAARLRADAGVRAFKLKIGPDVLQPVQERTLAALREVFDQSVELRVDANRSLARVSLSETFERLARYAPAFVEEPIDAPLPAELEGLPCGFALDESLATFTADRVRGLLGTSSCRAVVLKPTLLGGFSRCLELAGWARSCQRDVVVSHTLEGPVGFAACLHLAFALGGEVAQGLWPLPHQALASGLACLDVAHFAAAGLGAVG